VLKRVADVSYALSGADGLRLARGLGPDLILLDIEMPGMSGLDAIRALKAEPATTAIPVIFLTWRSGDADEASGLELGAIDYIAKPFNAAIMTARVRNQLQLVSYAKQLQALNEELERRATTDALTGLPNRRAFMETAAREAARFRRFGDPMGLLMIDIDHFKSINDTHGHDIGDIVLREVARRLAGLLRDTDTIGRLGGEEFAVILPRTDAEGARAVADRLLHALRGRPIPSDAGPIPVTATIGLSMLDPVETAIDAALKRADVALYDGKRGGRDRVVTG
jgi:two-component system, cell cycle response regulator